MIQCLRLNVPEDDDAHMVFLALPSMTYDEQSSKTPTWVSKFKDLEALFSISWWKFPRTEKRQHCPRGSVATTG
jgi:hypothetical protein